MAAADNTPVVCLRRTPGAPQTLKPELTFSSANYQASAGRLESNDITLPDRKISKTHCKMILRTCKQKGADDGEVLRRLFIRDFSSFGTFVNGTAIIKEQWVMLQHNDVVGLRNPHGNPGMGEYQVHYFDEKAQADATNPPATAAAAAAPAAPAAPAQAAPPSAPKLPKKAVSKPPAQPAPPAQEEALSPISEMSAVSAEEDNNNNNSASPQGGFPGLQGMPSMMPVLLPGMSMPVMMPTPMSGLPLPPGAMPAFPGPQPPTSPTPAPGNSGTGGSGGSAAGAAAAQAAVAAAQAAAARAPPVVLTVEEELVGKIIGRGGEVVKQLQKDSGARIDISKSSSDGKRSIYLSGSKSTVDKARAIIEETLGKARELAGISSSPNALVLKVSHDLVGILIGKSGETIKELKKESGARIEISKDSSDNSDERLVHITGPPECVEYAKKMVEETLEKASTGAGGNVGKVVEDVSALALKPVQMSVTVASDLVGMLIGRGGETINNISKDSGAKIEISKETAESKDKRTVYIYGLPEQCERAKRMIDDTLSYSRESRHRGGSASRSRSRRRSRSRSRSHGRPGRKVLHIGQEFIGQLIGRGGETIKGISRDTGARIEVSKDDRDTDRQVTLSGNPDSVERAIRVIDDIVRDARSKLESRADRRSDRRARSSSRRRGGGDEDRGSPGRDGLISEKVYVDEVEMAYRPSFLPEHEDGLHTDLEIFVRGLPTLCSERELWEHLYRLGATDVKEILLLRRQKVSKGMAYIVFNRHDHAVLAKHKLNGAPASSIPLSAPAPPEEGSRIMLARFSESERCINGRSCVYGTDMVGILLGARGKCMEEVKNSSGLRKVLLTGRSMRSFGQVDEDPRLHMVVYYEAGEVENVTKAIRIWGEQLGGVHRDIVEKTKGRGKGSALPPHGIDPLRPPMPLPGGPPGFMPPPRLPPPGFPAAGSPPPGMLAIPMVDPASYEAPVFLERRQLQPDSEDPTKMTPAGPSAIEGTSLRGRELRWSPWPEVTHFNLMWSMTPLRWGNRGELYVLLKNKETGDLRVVAADLRKPLEQWTPLGQPPAGSKSADYVSFTFNEHLFVTCIDRSNGLLTIYHVPDPSAAWNPASQTTLPETLGENDKMGLTRFARLTVFYNVVKGPMILSQDETVSKGVNVYFIEDPGKPWIRNAETLAISPKAFVLPVYSKPNTPAAPPGAPPFPHVVPALLTIDRDLNELTAFLVPPAPQHPWVPLTREACAGDSQLCCTYVPGKAEPVIMAGAPSERCLRLCHLNLLQWNEHVMMKKPGTPPVPLVEEKFNRKVESIWPEGRDGLSAELLSTVPLDCTCDISVSRHPWLSTPVSSETGAPPQASPPPPNQFPPARPGMPPPGAMPTIPSPTPGLLPPNGGTAPAPAPGPGPGGPPPGVGLGPGGAGPGLPPPGAAGTAPAGSGPPPGFGGPPPGFGGPPGFQRPPFGAPPFGAPPAGFEGPPPGFGKGAPPFDLGKGYGKGMMEKGGPPPFGMPPGGVPPARPPFDFGRPPPFGGPGGRPPFDAPPGQWQGAPGGGAAPPGGAPPAAGAAGGANGQTPKAQGDPETWEVGATIEGNFKQSGQWQKAKIVAKYPNKTFDVEYSGDFVEFSVPAAPDKLRPVAESAGAGGDAAEGERKHRHRHRHRRRHGEKKDEEGGGDGEKAEGGEGGETRHRRRHRHRRRRSGERDDDQKDGEHKHRSRRKEKSKSKSRSRSRSPAGDDDGKSGSRSRSGSRSE